MEKVVNPISPKYSLNRDDVKSVARGALIAMGGAFVTYLVEVLPKIDFGVWTPVVVAAISVLLNIFRKYLSVSKY